MSDKKIETYEPTMQGLKKGLAVARSVDGDRFLVLYSTCYLADHREYYTNAKVLYEHLFERSMEYALAKKIGKISMTETESKLRRENDLFNAIISDNARQLNLIKYHGQKELKE